MATGKIYIKDNSGNISELTHTHSEYTPTNNNPTLGWNATATIGTIGTVALTLKTPANPNTDIKVRQYEGTTNTERPILSRYNVSGTSQEANYVVYATGVTVNPSTNKLTASGGFVGNLTGTASNATNAVNATTATKLGSATVGSGTKPIYLNAGAPTAFTATVGGAAKPVWLNAGALTALTATVGSTDTPVYLNGGTITTTGKKFSDYALNSNVVHTTGNETVDGVKTFSQPIVATSNPLIKRTLDNVTIADTSRTAVNVLGFVIEDKDAKRVGGLEVTAAADGSRNIHYTMRNRANSAWISDFQLKENADGTILPIIEHSLQVNGEIKLKRINPYIQFVESDWKKGTPQTSGTSYQGLYFRGSDEVEGGHITYHYNQDKTSFINICAQNLASATASGTTTLSVGYNATSGAYVTAPTPTTADNSTKVATTAFVKAQGYLTSQTQLSISTSTHGGNAVTAVSVSNHAITLTKGSTFSLSNHTHSNYLATNGTAVNATKWASSTKTVSATTASGGANGDIHFQYI